MTAGVVVWITGLPGSGKSALAARVAERLRSERVPVAVLDGDEIRWALDRPAGSGESERDTFYASLARIAAVLARQGMAVLVAATAHRASYRDRARKVAPRYVEVHVATPVEECARRDPKGLYAAARSGRVAELPGAGAAFEPPAAPDVVAAGGEDAAAADRVVARVQALREPRSA